jgi:hypothetical protein
MIKLARQKHKGKPGTITFSFTKIRKLQKKGFIKNAPGRVECCRRKWASSLPGEKKGLANPERFLFEWMVVGKLDTFA